MANVETRQSGDVLSRLVDNKFRVHDEHVTDYVAITGEHLETLELGFAYLQRTILEDGTRTTPYIDIQKSFGFNVSGNEAIQRKETGEWVYVFSDGDEFLGMEETHSAGDKVGSLDKGIYLTKVLFSRAVVYGESDGFEGEEEL